MHFQMLANKIYCSAFLFFASCCVHAMSDSSYVAKIKLSKEANGIEEMSWRIGNNGRNYIDRGSMLGTVKVKYKIGNTSYSVSTAECKASLTKNQSNDISVQFNLPGGLNLDEVFQQLNGKVLWTARFQNNSPAIAEISDLSFPLPIGSQDDSISVPDNLNSHNSIIGNASFMYWIPYKGYGQVLMMTMIGNTSLEFYAGQWNNVSEIFIHSSTSVDRVKDTWRIPGTSAVVKPGKSLVYGFKFQVVNNLDEVRTRLYAEGCLDLRAAPGMTVPNDLSAYCLLRTKDKITKLIAEYPEQTTIEYVGPRKDGYGLYKFSFSKTGENLITVMYGQGKKAYLNFFSTEPLDVLIKKRSKFIAFKQQIKDTTKWYNGLYSIWDMEHKNLLSPDDKGPFPDFVVGGSDDPSNCKPLLLSEKNVVYPDKDEIASLEYYQKNFVWGKLQRTGDEYPYPYGIYGSENWFENRSGKAGDYNSGGWGKERMWRTFDYVTHIAIYFNLYKIARDYPEMVTYLDAKGYLERSYRTAIAFFTVPYNIEMGPRWAFHGWTDWAYKQGNFHERYIIELIDELVKNGETEKADVLKREWEKKVKYFIYDDPWPFASEMVVDRTAFESTYYVAEYAREHPLLPQAKLWYDKNKKIWYSHLSISDSATNSLMERQLLANLAIRGTIEPAFNLLGSAWAGTSYDLCYMSQMGGVAILDYGLKYAAEPCRYINIGYNSLLSSWALMNTGNEKDGFGYWYPGKDNDGAIGWIFTPIQHTTTYFRNIPAKRWVWQHDGEIDHGIVGAIHGASAIVTDDPLFGRIGYGCEIVPGKNNQVALIPKDGVRRRIHFYVDKQKVSLELYNDGFAKDSIVTFSPGDGLISFTIENRQTKTHECTISITNLEHGDYSVLMNGNPSVTLFFAEGKRSNYINIPVNKETQTVSIVKKR